MRIYEEKEIEPKYHPFEYRKFYLVLVAENELRIFSYKPKKLKKWETVEGDEQEDNYGHFYHERVRTGRYEIHWGIEEKYGNCYGIKVQISSFSEKVQSILKVDRVISIESNGEINIEIEA